MSRGWEHALEIGREMLAAAEGGAFGRVAELEDVRASLLPTLPAPTAELNGLLSEIVEADRRVVALTVAAHREAAAQLENHRRATAQAAAYAGMARVGA